MSEEIMFALRLLGAGMAGIFIVMIIIALSVKVLTLLSEIKKKKI